MRSTPKSYIATFLKMESSGGIILVIAAVIAQLLANSPWASTYDLLIYTPFNLDDPVALRGWAIPAATDIAFALGILSLLGLRVPTSIEISLTSLANFDSRLRTLFYRSLLLRMPGFDSSVWVPRPYSAGRPDRWVALRHGEESKRS